MQDSGTVCKALEDVVGGVRGFLAVNKWKFLVWQPAII